MTYVEIWLATTRDFNGSIWRFIFANLHTVMKPGLRNSIFCTISDSARFTNQINFLIESSIEGDWMCAVNFAARRFYSWND